MKFNTIFISIAFPIAFLLIAESCSKPKKGCTDPNAINYDAAAKESNGTCHYPDTLTTEQKLIGTWRVGKYFYSGIDKSTFYDTTYRNYTLQIDSNYFFNIRWTHYDYFNDSLIIRDTVGFDTLNSNYIIINDTLRYTDTTFTPYTNPGTWAVINDNTDLMFTFNNGPVAVYRFLALDSLELKLRKGNEEFHYHK